MRILDIYDDGMLYALHRGYLVRVELDVPEGGSPWDAEWYMFIQAGDGCIVSDGWIRDSKGMTLRAAFTRACEESEIAPPQRWPRIVPPNSPDGASAPTPVSTDPTITPRETSI